MRGKSSGIGFQITRSIAGAFPSSPTNRVGLHHEAFVLHPLDEPVGARAHRTPRQLFHAVLGREAGRQDLGAHLRHPDEEERIRLLRADADRGRVHDLDRLDRGKPRLHDGLARQEVSLERGLDVLHGERRAVVELDCPGGA